MFQKILENIELRNAPDLSLVGVDLIVDAMIGYGLVNDPRPEVATVIQQINDSRAPVLSLDTSSELDIRSGAPAKPFIRAHTTLTLALPKVGGLYPATQVPIDHLYLAYISVPPELYKNLGIDVPPLFLESTILAITKNGENYV